LKYGKFGSFFSEIFFVDVIGAFVFAKWRKLAKLKYVG
jgi:hypothetical protein